MENKIILHCWNSDSEESEIILDYDRETRCIGIVIKMLDATQRIAFFKEDLLLALKQLEIEGE